MVIELSGEQMEMVWFGNELHYWESIGLQGSPVVFEWMLEKYNLLYLLES